MGREIDGYVAEEVFDWDRWRVWGLHQDDSLDDEGEVPVRSAASVRSEVPHYSASVEADYTVLEHVREHWESGLVLVYRVQLYRIWREHGGGAFCYQPGDYSRAALAALGSEPDVEANHE